MERARPLQPQAASRESSGGAGAYLPFLVTYVVVWLLFLLLKYLLGFAWPRAVSGIDLLLLCLATFRLTALVTEEKVTRALRAPFCERRTITRPDGTVIEEEVPMGGGMRRTIGELILCPWCAGVWIATLLTFFWILLPGLARAVLIAFGVAAGGLLFEILAKWMDRARASLPD